MIIIPGEIMKSKKIAIAVTVLSAIVFVFNGAFQYLLPIFLLNRTSDNFTGKNSIAIIGGADGPTTILVGKSLSNSLFLVIPLLFFLLGIAYIIIVNIKNKR